MLVYCCIVVLFVVVLVFYGFQNKGDSDLIYYLFMPNSTNQIYQSNPPHNIM